jgi:3-phenylpropionate/trans-cinnamate dioxygenase ferredoxin reductase subunit
VGVVQLRGAGSNQVVVIGGGAAGLACAEHLRNLDDTAKVTLVDADRDQPYDRPPLSKDVLSGRVNAHDFGHRLRKQADDRCIQLVHDLVEQVEPNSRTILLRDTGPMTYDALVLAPGCTPINPWHSSTPGVRTMHSLSDVVALQQSLTRPAHVVLIGAGLIGLEVAAVLRGLEHQVTVIEAENLPLERILGAQVASRVASTHREKGVDFVLGQGVTDVVAEDDRYLVTLAGGSRVEADVVVCAIGVRPATSWLQSSPVELGARGEIVADQHLRTSVEGIWAAGDAVSWPSALLRGLRRVEHWTCAKEQGRYVAETLASTRDHRNEPFDTIPYFWSLQYGRMLQAAGSFDADTVFVEQSAVAADAFTARYVTNGELVGAASSGDPRGFLDMRAELEETLRTRAANTPS